MLDESLAKALLEVVVASQWDGVLGHLFKQVGFRQAHRDVGCPLCILRELV
jgi:hypothetical protein